MLTCTESCKCHYMHLINLMYIMSSIFQSCNFYSHVFNISLVVTEQLFKSRISAVVIPISGIAERRIYLIKLS